MCNFIHLIHVSHIEFHSIGARRTIDSIELLSDTTTQSDMLDNVLKKYELRDLYPKFERAGVVADIIWELDENMLSDSGLNAIEKHRYKKAKAKYDKRF